MIFYALGVIGFSGGNIFYDALIVSVSTPAERNKTSSLGFSLGYLGGGLLFLFNVLMYMYPQWFGLSGPADAVLWSFMSVAIWWLIFSMPLLLQVKEKNNQVNNQYNNVVNKAFSNLLNTAKSVRQYKKVVIFLLAYFLYMDGVDTVSYTHLTLPTICSV